MVPVTRTQAASQDDASLPGTSSTVPLSQDVMPLDFPEDEDDHGNLGEPQQATPHRQPARRPPRERPEVEDVLTQLTNVLVYVQRNQQRAAAAQPQAASEYAADPNFNWELLRTPAETRFPVPGLGSVQHIAADLLARLPTMAARDQHDA